MILKICVGLFERLSYNLLYVQTVATKCRLLQTSLFYSLNYVQIKEVAKITYNDNILNFLAFTKIIIILILHSCFF